MKGKLKRIRFRKDGKMDFETDIGTFVGCSLHIDDEEESVTERSWNINTEEK